MRTIDFKTTIMLTPNQEQKAKIQRTFQAYKWVYNHFLQLRMNEDPDFSTRLFPAAAYSRMLTQLRKDIPLLNGVSSHVLQSALHKLSVHFGELYYGKRKTILPLNHYTEYGIEVRPPSISFGDKWVRFPKIGKVRHKHKVNDNLDVFKLVFNQPSENTFSVDMISKMEVEE